MGCDVYDVLATIIATAPPASGVQARCIVLRAQPAVPYRQSRVISSYPCTVFHPHKDTIAGRNALVSGCVIPAVWNQGPREARIREYQYSTAVLLWTAVQPTGCNLWRNHSDGPDPSARSLLATLEQY